MDILRREKVENILKIFKVLTTFKELELTPYIGNQLIRQMTDISSFMMLHDSISKPFFLSPGDGMICWFVSIKEVIDVGWSGDFPWGFRVTGVELRALKDFSSEPLEQRLKSRDLSRRCSAYSDAQVRSCPLHPTIIVTSSYIFILFLKWLWYHICWFMLPCLKKFFDLQEILVLNFCPVRAKYTGYLHVELHILKRDFSQP